jgi:hypothetical protein
MLLKTPSNFKKIRMVVRCVAPTPRPQLAELNMKSTAACGSESDSAIAWEAALVRARRTDAAMCG